MSDLRFANPNSGALVFASGISEPLYLSPAGGGAGDWDRLFNVTTGLATLAASAGQKVVCRGGPDPWIADVVRPLPSNLHLEFEPNATIVSTIANGTGNANAVFFSGATTGASTTVSTNATVGSRTLAVAATDNFPAGTRIAVGAGNRFAYYTVVSRSVSSGAGNLIVDRPLLYAFASAETVYVITAQPTGIRLIGNGATISGTGDRAIEISAGLNCIVEGFNIDATTGFGGIVASMDVGGYNCHFRDIKIVGGYDAQGGIALESNEASTITNCIINDVATSAAHIGVYITDCVDCHVARVHSTRNVIGISIEGADTAYGCRWCTLSDSMSVGNSNDGLRVINTSQAVTITGCSALYNGQHGFSAANSSTFAVDACNSSNNTGSGLNTTAGTIARVSGSRFADNALDDITAAGDVVVINCDMQGGAVSSCIALTSAANATITCCRIAPNTTNGVAAYGIQVGTTGIVEISDVLITLSGTGTKVGVYQNAAGKSYLSNVRQIGGAYGAYVSAGAMHWGSTVDFSAATTPITLGGTIDSAGFAGYAAIAMTTADKTATWAEYAAGTLIISGTLGAARNLIMPKIAVPWVWKNNADQNVTIKGSTGTGFTIAPGATARGIFDGTNFVQT